MKGKNPNNLNVLTQFLQTTDIAVISEESVQKPTLK